MIMLLTQDSGLREQLRDVLQQTGHQVAIPAHREHILPMLEDSPPSLIILDLHLSHPSGPDDLKMIRARGYVGRTIVLSSPPMMSVLAEANASGVDRTVKVPIKINGRYDLGPLQCMVTSCLQDQGLSARPTDHESIAQRAYELYEAGDRHEGCDLQHWFQAERDVVLR
jgi:CheY-like chemotaxis protein